MGQQRMSPLNLRAKEESASAETEAAAAEPVPEIVISDSVSVGDVTAESEKATEVSVEEEHCPEPEVESKMENGDAGSPSVTQDVADIVNGKCRDDSATHAEECVNGNEKLEEMPVKEQSDFELKKDVNLCGDVQEVCDAVSDMVEGISTEVTQAV